jgi:hypothetical protein
MEIVFSRDCRGCFIPKILAIDSAVYPKELQGSMESVCSRFARNKDSYILAIEREEIVGYFCFFPIRAKLLEKILSSKCMYDDDIKGEDILPYRENNTIFFISAAIFPEYQDKEVIIHLCQAFERFFREKIVLGQNIDQIVCYVISDDGYKLATRLNFKVLKEVEGGYYLMQRNDFHSTN